MDGIGAEVSQKIRSAIKAKLMELGVYVDEELPDYIMVMVANKRSREQMEDDLQLFLGSNTEEFTLWLHQVLQKLQEVTVASLERKRKSSTVESEGEIVKKDKRRKSSERKKVRRSDEQARGKDSKAGSEDVNQQSGKHRELEKVTSPTVSSNQVKINMGVRDSVDTDDNVDKSQEKTETEQVDKIGSLSHKLGNEKSNIQVSSDSESSHNDKKDGKSDSGKLHGDGVSFKCLGKSQSISDSHERSDEINSEKSGIRKISLIGRTNSSSKIICSSMEETSNVPESSLLNPIKKGTNTGNQSDNTKHGVPDKQFMGSVEKTTVEINPNAEVTRPKIILMQSDDDDDDDEDFINIKADAEAEELLNAELPKESPDTSCNGVTSDTKIVSTVLNNKSDRIVTSVTENKQNSSNVRGLQLSDRLGAKVNSGSILDRLGVRKVTALTREINKSNSPLLRITDRLGEKVTPTLTDRLGVRKISTLRSDNIMEHKDTNFEDKQCSMASRLSNRLGSRIMTSGFSSDRRSISVLSHSERRNVSVAQVAPTTVIRSSRLMNIKDIPKTEPEQLGSKSLRRPLDEVDEDETDDKTQIPRKRPLLSRVVAMRREASCKEEEEEYDPTNPAVGSVASVVRVKPRPKVPAALQANKNLILKAMAEAQKSVANAPKRVEPAERPDNLYTKKFRDGKGKDKIAITLPNRRMNPRKESPVNEKSSDIERIVIPVKLEPSRSISSVNLQQKIVIQVSSDKAVPQGTVSPPETSSKFEEVPVEEVNVNLNCGYDEENTKLLEATSENEIEELKEESLDGVQRLITYESQSTWSKDLELENDSSSIHHPIETTPEIEAVSLSEVSRAESPQFVVTLDGLDPSIFHTNSRKKQLQQPSSVVLNTSNLDLESPSTEYEEKEMSGSEDMLREKQLERRAASPILYKKSSSSDVTGPTLDTTKQKINERCKYWPACRLGDKCDYLHPTVPCKSFPSCKFGDKCLYIHPNCKFDASCTRRDCPFTHASPRNISSTTSSAAPRSRASSTTTRVSQQVCKFFPKCSNVNCRFLHPKACRYGRYCSRKTDCSFLHEDLPSADKLKWFCPFRL